MYMKRIISIFLFLTLAVASVCSVRAEISVNAEACVLYCPDSGEVYFSKNENKRMRPASTTKLMTALITLEYAEKNNKKVEFTSDMTAEGSSMYLKFGEVVTLKDLAVGLLMRSGNDAANAAAVAIAGSKEKFAKLMNKRARKIGMKNTHFVTPSGLDDDDHYSTAYDLALLMAEAMRNEAFSALCGKKSESVRFVKPKGKSVTYANHNRLLSLYPNCVGGKTGYTIAAGRCLVTAARKDGLTLIAVTLNDKRDWNDHIALYNYGFENYKMKLLDDSDFHLNVSTVGGEKDITIVSSFDCERFVLPAGDYSRVKRKISLENFLYAPIKSGETVGQIVYSLNGKALAVHKLIAEEDNSFKENKKLFGIF